MPILDVIREDCGDFLRAHGDKWRGLCPFCEAPEPKFMVSPPHNIFHCFACGVGGDVYGWLMKRRGLTFPEAVEIVRRTGQGD